MADCKTTENQRIEIEGAGYKIDYWFVDQGISGKTHSSARPQFGALLAQIRDGETLVVTKMDRLGRDAQDVIGTIKALAKRKISVIVLQLGKLDLSSAAGKLILGVIAAVAEIERDLLVERTQAGLERAKAQGKKLGQPFKTTPAQRKEMVILHQQGSSISALARLNNVSRATVMRIVKPDGQ